MAQTDGATRTVAGACLALLLMYACVGADAAWPTADECNDGLVLTTCGSGNPDFSNCFRQGLQKDLLLLKKGNKKLGLDPIDPLTVKEIVVNLPLQRTLRLNNLVVTGLSELTVDSMAIVPGSSSVTRSISYSFFIPELQIQSPYILKGLRDNADSLGTTTISIRNYTASFQLDSLEQEEEDGNQYLVFTRCRSKFLDAAAVDVVLTGISGRSMKLDLTSNEAFQKAIAKKQAEITYAYLIRVYQFAPPLSIWFNPNVTGTQQICLHPRAREGVTCVDICSRGF